MYPGDDWSQKLPFPAKKPDQREAYEMMFTMAEEEFGLAPMRFSQQWYRDGAFTKAWAWKKRRWVKLRKKVRPDLIMDKSTLSYESLTHKMEIHRRFLSVNPWELDLLSSDKMLTATTFSELSPETYLVRSSADLRDVLKKLPAGEVVLKPRLGYGGEGVRIISKRKAQQVKVRGLTVVQRFVDTSAGVPGLYKGIHDFRVIYAGDKPFMAYIRTAAPGTKLCNMSLGGGVIFVPVSKIPKVLKPHLSHVVKTFAAFPHKLFSVDFFFERGKPRMVELNSKPMVYFPPGHERQTMKMQRAYLKYFASII